jgi:glutamyl-tRNA reductase
MNLFLTGLSHKTAPIEVREWLAFSGEDLEVALGRLRRLPGVTDAVLLCTCNRTEVYGLAGEPEAGAGAVADWMGQRTSTDLSRHLYVKTGAEALSHLFRVSASLDSMVLGEPQILGQVKTAFSDARRVGAAGPRIERLFSRAFRVAKRVRTETRVGENAVSMAFVAVELARKVFGELAGRTVLLIGAGKMCELAATHLRTAGVARFLVANRSLERAEDLAARYGGEARPLRDVEALLEEADIVLSSTAAPGFLISREQMAKAVKKRRYRPIFLIDLAVPRDIDPAVNDLSNVYAYDVDDIEKAVEENREHRGAEAERAEHLVRAEVADLIQEAQARRVRPVVAALRHEAASVAEMELARTLARLEALGVPREAEESVRAMARAIVNKLLHEPTATLKAVAASEEGERLAASVVSLFSLDVDAVAAAIAEEKARRRAEREAAGFAATPAGDDVVAAAGQLLEGAAATTDPERDDGNVVPLDAGRRRRGS